MVEEKDNLEQQCEDAVFQICCTRERYSVRCANQLEKYLDLKTELNTAPVRKSSIPNFEIPVSTDDQEELHKSVTKSSDCKKNAKNDMRSISNRLKELKSIANQIERSRKTETRKLLEE